MTSKLKEVFLLLVLILVTSVALLFMDTQLAEASVGKDIVVSALVNFVYAALGFTLGIVVLVIVDRRILKAIDLVGEIREKNTAAALFAVGCVFSICYLLAHTLG